MARRLPALRPAPSPPGPPMKLQPAFQRRHPILTILGVATAAVAAAAAVPGLQMKAQAATAIPARVFAPYFEAYTGDSPLTLSHKSGAKYQVMAFIQTASHGSCTAYWNG